MEKRGPKFKLRQTSSVVDAITWVMQFFYEDGMGASDAPDPLTRAMWTLAHKSPEHFFKVHVPKAIVAKEAEGTKDQVQQDSEKHLEHLGKRLGTLLKGTELVYCQKCWAEIKPGEGVRVVQ